MGKYTGKPYRPSNGTSGMMFEEKFCQNCIHEKFMHTQKHGDKQCDIFNRAFLHDLKDKEYPKEWQYDKDDKPTCTAWKKWDWGSGGSDGNGWNEPEPPEPYNPNQFVFPFIIDEVNDNVVEKQEKRVLEQC